MSHPLETPELGDDGKINWELFWLYRRKRGVLQPRPHFTGDVFVDVPVIGEDSPSNVVVLQHPCALRGGDSDLRPVLVTAKLVDREEVPLSGWLGNYDLLPLIVHEGDPHRAVAFDQLAMVKSSDLVLNKRVACMEIEGVSYLLQRWTNANTRVVVPCWRFVQGIEEQFAEADGLEAWCTQRQQAGVKPAVAVREASDWLDRKSDDTGQPRRDLLKVPKNHKGLVRRMEVVAKERTAHDLEERARIKAERNAQQESSPAPGAMKDEQSTDALPTSSDAAHGGGDRA